MKGCISRLALVVIELLHLQMTKLWLPALALLLRNGYVKCGSHLIQYQ